MRRSRTGSCIRATSRRDSRPGQAAQCAMSLFDVGAVVALGRGVRGVLAGLDHGSGHTGDRCRARAHAQDRAEAWPAALGRLLACGGRAWTSTGAGDRAGARTAASAATPASAGAASAAGAARATGATAARAAARAT